MLHTRREDQIFEDLLTRKEIDDEEFADLSEILATISQEGTVARIDDKAAKFAEIAARMARSGEGGTTRRIRHRGRPLIPRLATAALALVLVIGMTGVAAAADVSRPGDLLYGVDRALERIGINDGGLSERIAEADDLVASGSPSQALDHLADSVGTVSAGAADALEDAAEKVRAAGPSGTPSHLVREDVASMLEWMARSDVSGKDFGQGVAERARNIGRASPEPAGDPGPPVDPNNQGGNGLGKGNGNGPPGGSPPGQRGP